VPKPGVTLAEAEAALDQAIAEFLDEGIDPEQFDRVKRAIRATEIYAQDSTQGLARRYGAGLSSGLTLEDIEAWPDILQATTADEVMEAARQIFDKRRAVTSWEVVVDAEEANAGGVSQ
jgi:zinc protease